MSQSAKHWGVVFMEIFLASGKMFTGIFGRVFMKLATYLTDGLVIVTADHNTSNG